MSRQTTTWRHTECVITTMPLAYQQWCSNAEGEVTSLLNAFQASSMGEMHQRTFVCQLENRIGSLENEASQVLGQDSILRDTAAAIDAGTAAVSEG